MCIKMPYICTFCSDIKHALFQTLCCFAASMRAFKRCAKTSALNYKLGHQNIFSLKWCKLTLLCLFFLADAFSFLTTKTLMHTCVKQTQIIITAIIR